MSNIIVVGCGRVGSRLALMLSNYENNVCVIDRDPRAFASLGRDFNGATFAGVGYDEDVLMKAGIDECDFLAAVTQSDNVNLMVVEIARRLYDVPLVAEEIFSKISSGLGDHITTLGDCEVVQFALDLSQTRSDYIKVSDLESRHKIRVCAFERADGEISSIPTPSSVLYHGDTVLVALRHGMIPEIAKYMQN